VTRNSLQIRDGVGLRGSRRSRRGHAHVLTAISEAVNRYVPEREAVVVIPTEKVFEVSIVTPNGYDLIGGLLYDPSED
jgi:hypothetical protein